MKHVLLDSKGRSEEEFLASYTPKDYEKPSLTVDILIITKTVPMKILLIQRKNHPYIEQWALPGGFVNMDESLHEAARRELKEETGVDAVSLTQLHTYGDVHRDPRMRVISVAYLARISDILSVCARDDAKEADWFDIKQTAQQLDLISSTNHIQYKLDNTSCIVSDDYDTLAFDHVKILLDALREIKKTSYELVL